jgi:hypothetical protein
VIDVRLIRACWCKETSFEGTGAKDSPVGQCGVTALLVLHLTPLGTKIVRAPIPGFRNHYWNRLWQMGDVDLTRAQYPDGTEIPPGAEVDINAMTHSFRARRFRTLERFQLMLDRYVKLGGRIP